MQSEPTLHQNRVTASRLWCGVMEKVELHPKPMHPVDSPNGVVLIDIDYYSVKVGRLSISPGETGMNVSLLLWEKGRLVDSGYSCGNLPYDTDVDAVCPLSDGLVDALIERQQEASHGMDVLEATEMSVDRPTADALAEILAVAPVGGNEGISPASFSLVLDLLRRSGHAVDLDGLDERLREAEEPEAAPVPNSATPRP